MSVTVSVAQMQRFVLGRHGLLARLGGGLEANLDALLPLHATSRHTPVLSLLARVDGFAPAANSSGASSEHLDEFLERMLSVSTAPDRRLHLLRCMRGTLHIVNSASHSRLLRLYGGATLEAPGTDERLQRFGVPPADARSIRAAVEAVLRDHGPQTTRSIQGLLPAAMVRRNPPSTVRRGDTPQLNVSVVMHWLFDHGALAYGIDTPPFDWRSYRRCYAMPAVVASVADSSAAAKTPPAPSRGKKRKRDTRSREGSSSSSSSGAAEADVGEDADLAAHALWYFSTYGPASLRDFVWWAGRKVRECRGALEALRRRGDVVPVEVSGFRGADGGPPPALYIARASAAALASTAATPALRMVRLLPYEDALIKAYKETRHRFWAAATCAAADRLLALCFHRGEAWPTVWLDGAIVGRWHWTAAAGASAAARESGLAPVTVVTPTPLTAAQRSRLRAELTGVRRFIASGSGAAAAPSDDDGVAFEVHAGGGTWRKT